MLLLSVREKWERGGWRSAAQHTIQHPPKTIPFSKSKSIHHLLGEILFSLTNDWLLLRWTLTRTGKLSTFLLLRRNFSFFLTFSRFECPLQLQLYTSVRLKMCYNFVCVSRPLKFWTANKHSGKSRSINKIQDGKKRKKIHFSRRSAASIAGHNRKILVLPRPRRAITLVKFVINFASSSFSISQRCLQIIQRMKQINDKSKWA